MTPGPIGGTLGSSVPSSGRAEECVEQEPELEHPIGRCKRCGKQGELVDGLCTECKWEIDVGLQHPIQQERKHHFWTHDNP
jgi:hypothetical protein